jgi:hypothetical protein
LKNYNSLILQGSFPGCRPHSSVLLNLGNDYFSLIEEKNRLAVIRRHPNNLIIQQKQNNYDKNIKSQCSGSINIHTYPIDITRVNFNSHSVSLPKIILQKMEKVFNADFSGVKIHTEGREAETLGALAFTAGNDIYFATGRYNPYTPRGQQLLGHELTHVIQQKEGRINGHKGSGIAAVHSPILEAEADRMGVRIVEYFNDDSHNANIYQNDLIQLMKRVKDTPTQNDDVFDLIIQFIKEGNVDSVASSMFGINIDNFKDYYFKKYNGEAQGKLWLLALINSGEVIRGSNLESVCNEYRKSSTEENKKNVDEYIQMNYMNKFRNDISIYKELKKLYSSPPELSEIKDRLSKAREYLTTRLNEAEGLAAYSKTHVSLFKIKWIIEQNLI